MSPQDSNSGRSWLPCEVIEKRDRQIIGDCYDRHAFMHDSGGEKHLMGLDGSPGLQDVEMDPDEDLPWPDPELIQQWWSSRQGEFQSDTRYLLVNP